MSRRHELGEARIGVGLRIEFADALLADDSPPVDFVEVHPENFVRRGGAHATMLARARERFGVTTHGLTMGFADREAPTADEVRALARLVRSLDAPLHSDHLAITRRRGRFVHDLLPPPFERATVETARAHIRRLSDVLQVPVAVENLSYYVPRALDPLVEADLLAEVLEAADARLLLDVNNVVVNAHNHRFDPRAYLARLPLARVACIHVAGHAVRADGLRIDTHAEAISTEVFDLLREVLSSVGPVPVLLERDGGFAGYGPLRDELQRLRATVELGLAAHRASGRADRTSSRGLVPDVPRAHAPRGLASPAERRGEPADVDALHDATFDHLLAEQPAPLGDATTAPRYALQRELVRGRLRELLLGALPRTTRAVSAVALTPAIDRFLADPGPRSAVFHELVPSFGAALHAHLPHDVADLLAVDLAEWAVRQEPAEPVAPTADVFEASSRVVLAPARRVVAVQHAVHAPLAPLERPARAEAHVVVFADAGDAAVVLALDAVSATLLAALEACPTLADAIVHTATAHDLVASAHVREGIAAVLAQWSALGLVRGTARPLEPACEPATA